MDWHWRTLFSPTIAFLLRGRFTLQWSLLQLVVTADFA
jgi:hypothetical protein